MTLTQQSIVSLLIEEGGRLKKADLVGKFTGWLDSVDPAQKERNKELFKTFVNNVAVVKEIDGVRYVVLKKTYQHMLEGAKSREEKAGNEEIPLPGEQQRPPVRAGSPDDSGGVRSAASEPDREEASESSDHPTELLSPMQMALRRNKYPSIRMKRVLNVEVHQQDADGKNYSNGLTKTKPFALPLRVPPGAKVEWRRLKADPDEPPEDTKPDVLRDKRRMPSVERGCSTGSPQLRRAAKNTKASEEHKDTRIPSVIPLEQSEHEWLVQCAAGHWSHVYGLFLRDNQLAEKKDFMSGFTALHWAAKSGNTDMLVKIIDKAREGGVDIDVNVKTHGGYTPLHIAALHGQEYIICILVKEYGANIRIRDNCGKKAYHYLHNGVSGSVREMLCEPKEQPTQDRAPHEKDELDSFPDLSKGLHSISRLFQPNITGHKKKHKQRVGLYSLSEDPSDEQEDSRGGLRHRPVSDVM